MIHIDLNKIKKLNLHRSGGFALPTVLIASIIMLMVLLSAVTSVAATRLSLTNQYYNLLAKNASDAGVAYAKACLAANNGVPQWTDAKPLTSETDCAGTNLNGLINVLVVGGGGGGASGGGGAGGVSYSNSINVTAQAYKITVGGGGTGGLATGAGRGNGLVSSFSTILAAEGGGAGGYNDVASAANQGASGGGGGSTSTNYTIGGVGIQGKDGGSVTSAEYKASPYPSAGGGGAGAVGSNPASGAVSGDGGVGLSYAISGIPT
jgi:hypothetical protein